MNRKSGFSLVELLVAMLVVSIILAAVATFAYAFSNAYDSSGDVSEKQSILRYTALRLSNLIRNSRLICASSWDYLVLWQADDNGNGQINVSEIVYVDTTWRRDCLQLLRFYPLSPADDATLSLRDLRRRFKKWQLTTKYPTRTTTLIPDCEDIQIYLDVYPPETTFVNIVFDIRQNEKVQTYQIGTALRCRAGNLIGRTGEIVSVDDD